MKKPADMLADRANTLFAMLVVGQRAPDDTDFVPDLMELIDGIGF